MLECFLWVVNMASADVAAKAGALFMRNNYDKLGRVISVYDSYYGVNIKTTQYDGLTTTHTSSPGGFQADQTSVTTKNVAGQTAQGHQLQRAHGRGRAPNF